MELQNKIQNGVIMSIEEHNNLMNEVKTLKLSVDKLEEQLNIKNNVDIQICKITEYEMIKLINNNNLTLEKVKQWDLQSGNLMIKGNYGRTIIHSASKMGQLDIIQYIFDKGNEINNIDIDYLNYCNETPLIYASRNGQIEVINYLLDRGANINHQDKFGLSSLHYTCLWNKLEVVKVLVEKGKELKNIDIDLKNNNNETALDLAKLNDHQEIVDYLKSVIKERLKTDYENKLRELDRD